MKIALYSDLHLECLPEPWQPPLLDVDVVILAGDIARHTHGLKWATTAFTHWPRAPKIFYIAGNHEYYDAHLGLLTELRKSVGEAAGVRFLEKDSVVLPGIRILGCTLWSGFELYGADRMAAYMNEAGRAINDYRLIYASGGQRLKPLDTLRLHRQSVYWLASELAKPFDGKTVVVTHFAPHQQCVSPQFQNSVLSPYFVTDLSRLMSAYSIDVWCHGHTHTNNDFVAENGCRVISNQRGYPGEVPNSGFQAALVIEV
jgi:predicted phosphodiesterase